MTDDKVAPDLVERLNEATFKDVEYWPSKLLAEAAAALTSLSAEREQWAAVANREDECRQMWQERAKAAEARIKELEREIRDLREQIDYAWEVAMGDDL